MHKILGDYKILKQIGQGSFGAAFLAEHRYIKKQYVLKVLPEELAQDSQFVKNFEEEVAKLASLDHPHIIKVHTVSSFDNLYYLVSDCVLDTNGDSTNLAAFMSARRERLKEEELYRIANQIADAIDYAHLKGQVIHRSLKLNNILVSKSKEGIEVYISDFGLSKIISPQKALARMLKETAGALGLLSEGKEMQQYPSLPIDGDNVSKLSHSFLQSFAFLAPEQKRNEAVTLHADTYAFGVLIYYLIAGQFPEGIFPMPSQIVSSYNFDWDALITSCLTQDFLSRPSQLLPILEKIANRPRLDYASQRDKMNEREEVGLDKLREKLTQTLSKPAQEKSLSLAAASATFTPIIGKGQETIEAVTVERATSFVESKDVSEATAHVLTPEITEGAMHPIASIMNREPPLVTQYQPEKKEAKAVESLPTEMRIIPAGECYRGSNEGNRDEMPRHRIFLDPFAVDIHPVTNEQFVRFLESNGGEKDQDYHDLIRLKDSRISRSSGKLFVEPGYAKHPVVGVTWYGAFGYAKWVGKRLPTEAEWEVACQGGLENSSFPTGDSIEKNQANFFSSDTTVVMSYPPNGFGIYDMVGNVYEWCSDWYGYNFYETSSQEPYNPKGPQQGVYRVLRGGCWKSLKEDLRSAHRHRNNPGTVNSTYGFRCAADVRKI